MIASVKKHIYSFKDIKSLKIYKHVMIHYDFQFFFCSRVKFYLAMGSSVFHNQIPSDYAKGIFRGHFFSVRISVCMSVSNFAKFNFYVKLNYGTPHVAKWTRIRGIYHSTALKISIVSKFFSHYIVNHVTMLIEKLCSTRSKFQIV